MNTGDRSPRLRTIAKDAQLMLDRAAAEGTSTAWSRLHEQEPQCGYCAAGVSCSNCSLGPCRVNPFGAAPTHGVCGADADVIVARNLGRHIAAGAASHSDHARDILETFEIRAAELTGPLPIRDHAKLRALAADLGIPLASRSEHEIANDLLTRFFDDFGSRRGALSLLHRVPAARRAIWERLRITPRGIDREPAEMLHRTHMGVDSDSTSLVLHALRTALSDGWGGSMIASELSDVLLGTPTPTRSLVGLGTLREDAVNVALHGHNALLSEALVEAAQDPEILQLATRHGAHDINLVGLCCTGNELLARHRIPSAGNFLMQELALMTGALDAMVVDYQCVMPSITDVAGCFHTAIVSTSDKGRLPGALHVPLEPPNERRGAREILRHAIARFALRDPERVQIPGQPISLMAGYSVEAVLRILGGSPDRLVSALADGRIRGVVALVGCSNPKVPQDQGHLELVRRLIAQDILVLATGCAAVALGKGGLLLPEAATHAGPGLRGLCEELHIPPVLHFGSCADNARILVLAATLANHLGVDISELPIAAAAPEWYSEKALAIGAYAVASGIFTVLGLPPAIAGSRKIVNLLSNDLLPMLGARLVAEPRPEDALELIQRHLETKRRDLGLPYVDHLADIDASIDPTMST